MRRASPPCLVGLVIACLWCLALSELSTLGVATPDGSSSGKDAGSGVTIQRFDPSALDAILTAAVEVLVRDRLWTEGPLYWKDRNSLLFSDVRDNAIYSWTGDAKKKKDGGDDKEAAPATATETATAVSGSLSELIRPSGWLSSSEAPRMWEPGSNGLALDKFGNLVAAQHGERQIARVPLSELKEQQNGNKSVSFRSVASRFQGRRFNSLNDLAFNPLNGDLWFTDPVYGLEKYGDDPKRELNFQGVFRIPATAFRKAVVEKESEEEGRSNDTTGAADAAVTLEISSLSNPNGLAFSPDGSTLFVSNSGKEASFWASFEIDGATGRVVKKKKQKVKTQNENENINESNGTCSDPFPSSTSLSLEEEGGTKLWDVTAELQEARKAGRTVGASDGFKISEEGIVFASAIDSVFVFSPRFQKLLGKIVVGDKIGNVAFGGVDGNELFIAANSRILRVKTKVKGSFFVR